ncbi:MAG: DnaJ C-terminal domain-containing protein [Polyangiales bacterium]
MATERDYYAVLGVERGASGEEIKRAYRRVAAKLHPDRNPDDPTAEEAFKKASEAYRVLSDETLRRRYDRFGAAGFGQGQGGPHFEAVDFSSVSELLEGLFGSVVQGMRRTRSGRDLRYDLRVSFLEAALGTDKEITLPPSSSAHAVSPTLQVRVPAGVMDGAVRTVRGAGEGGPGGPGDLHVYIRVDEHPLLRREGADIYCTLPISFPQAVLGAQVEVPTLEGTVQMRIPPGTPSHKKFRLRGKGIPVFGGYGRGDHYVTVQVEVPTAVNSSQKALIEALHEELSQAPSAAQRSFMSKLKGMFRGDASG